MQFHEVYTAEPRLNINDWSTCSTDFPKSSKPISNGAYCYRKLKVGETAELIDYNSRTYITKEVDWKEIYLAANESIRRGNFERAAALCLKAFSMLKSAPYTDPRVEATIDNLVECYQKLQKHKEAEVYCLRALEVKRRLYGQLNSRVATCLNKLGGIYYLSNQYEKVETCCLEAEKIYVALRGNNSENVATVAGNLAHLYHAQGNFVAARKRYLQALRIKKSIRQQGDSEWTALYKGYAYLLSTTGFN